MNVDIKYYYISLLNNISFKSARDKIEYHIKYHTLPGGPKPIMKNGFTAYLTSQRLYDFLIKYYVGDRRGF
jgi:hypothetical protein